MPVLGEQMCSSLEFPASLLTTAPDASGIRVTGQLILSTQHGSTMVPTECEGLGLAWASQPGAWRGLGMQAPEMCCC